MFVLFRFSSVFATFSILCVYDFYDLNKDFFISMCFLIKIILYVQKMGFFISFLFIDIINDLHFISICYKKYMSYS